MPFLYSAILKYILKYMIPGSVVNGRVRTVQKVFPRVLEKVFEIPERVLVDITEIRTHTFAPKGRTLTGTGEGSLLLAYAEYRRRRIQKFTRFFQKSRQSPLGESLSQERNPHFTPGIDSWRKGFRPRVCPMRQHGKPRPFANYPHTINKQT